MKNLQEAIEYKLVGDIFGNSTAEINIQSNLENFNNDFQRYIFDSHVKAYIDAGLLELSILEKVKIALTPDFKDLFSPLGLKQSKDVGLKQASYYLENPIFAASQAKEAYDNWDLIVKMASEYCENQKKSIQPKGCPTQNDCIPCEVADVLENVISVTLNIFKK